MEAAIDRIIEFLENCGNADIEAGVGFLFGNGGQDDREKFRSGIRKAIGTDALMPVYGSKPVEE